MTVRSAITSQFTLVAQEQGKQLKPLTDDLPLLECGLDSLCFAILVARLEDELSIDPFAAGEDEAFPLTIGDFVRLYETVAA
jgi:acyl carrier protein